VQEGPRFAAGLGFDRVIARFFECEEWRQASLVELLADESEFWSDGGGQVPAARVLTERAKIAGFFAGPGASKAFREDDFKLEFTPSVRVQA
jgi:hypothetical protein